MGVREGGGFLSERGGSLCEGGGIVYQRGGSACEGGGSLWEGGGSGGSCVCEFVGLVGIIGKRKEIVSVTVYI